jgi:hypothetical protein
MDKPTAFTPLEQQPVDIRIKETSDLFVHRTVVHKANTALTQHSHEWAHLSFIAVGGVRVWADSRYLGEFDAPDGIEIAAGVEHMFVTTKDGTIIDCIHRLENGEPKVAKEAKPLI